MSADRGFVIAVIVVVAVAGSIPAFPRDTRAQTSSVDFLVADSNVVLPTNAPNDPGDIVVVTGRPLGTADGGTCGPTHGEYPVQDVVVIDPGLNRATRLTGVIFVASTDPVRPGTKLGNITGVGNCNVGATGYTKYRGTVE